MTAPCLLTSPSWREIYVENINCEKNNDSKNLKIVDGNDIDLRKTKRIKKLTFCDVSNNKNSQRKNGNDHHGKLLYITSPSTYP